MACGQLDALIFPSRHALEEHRRRGIGDAMCPLSTCPISFPTTGRRGSRTKSPSRASRPYLAAAGRLVTMKGFQRLIPMMRYLPEVDLRIAGTGPYEAELRALAAGLPNVQFEGLLGGESLARLFRGARAVVVPSLFPETFGYVVLEAFAVGTPVVVHEGGGALQETGVAERRRARLPDRRRAAPGPAADGPRRGPPRRAGRPRLRQRIGEWSETEHIHSYFELIGRYREAAGNQARLPAASRRERPWPTRGRPWRTSRSTARPDAAAWGGTRPLGGPDARSAWPASRGWSPTRRA